MSHEATVILDRMVLVKVEANIYGARKKLKKGNYSAPTNIKGRP